jgi:hypothetical protein
MPFQFQGTVLVLMGALLQSVAQTGKPTASEHKKLAMAA